MRAVDTNVLVRLFVRDNAKQAAAAEEFIAPGAWVPHIALVETVWVLDSIYRKSRSEIGQFLNALLDHTSLVIQDADVVAAALDAFRNNKGVGFADCIILEVARKAGHTPLGTFDTKLAKIDGTALI
ncbi:MAG: type II toxin-antitoxin system VapC family toxin [Acidobacteria bacterium]|nr:type II toxin-antitoxin system VapC family toxin [Acidobacteriota bacterium]